MCSDTRNHGCISLFSDYAQCPQCESEQNQRITYIWDLIFIRKKKRQKGNRIDKRMAKIMSHGASTG